MAENKLADLSTKFAIQILKLTENIKGHYSLSNQLERSATSIGANIREAKYAHSRPDFIAKLTDNRCTFTYFYLDFAPFGYSLAEKNQLLFIKSWFFLLKPQAYIITAGYITPYPTTSSNICSGVR